MLSGGDSISFRTAPPHHENVRDLLTNSFLYVDALVARHVPASCQFALLYGGCDTRAFNHGPVVPSRLERYEVDVSSTQRTKVAALKRAGVFIKGVTFARLVKWDLVQSLKATAFDTSKPTIFLCEGATLHMSEQRVRKTLRAVKYLAAPGSVLITQFYGTSMFTNPGFKEIVQRVLDLTNERIRFLMDFSVNPRREIEKFVQSDLSRYGRQDEARGIYGRR